jgi:multiple sugar transport system substrate-binding protein
MKVRLLFLITLVLVIGALLTACTAAVPVAPQGEEAAPVAESEAVAPTGETLTFWMKKSLAEDSNTAIEARVAQFEAETGIDVELRILPYEDFRPQWAAAIESGNVPDVSFFGYQEVGQYYQQGVLMDVSDVVADLQAANGPMTESLVNAVTFDGMQYGVPFWSESTILFYRKDLFEAAGLSGAPDTWDQFLESAKALTNPAEGVYGAGFGIGRSNSDAEWWFRDIIWSNGGFVFSDDGQSAALDTPQAQASLQWIADMFTTAEVTPPGAVGWDDSGNNKSYLSGQAAMVINVGSVYFVLNRDNPELLANTGFALVPAGPEGRYIAGIANNLGIFSEAKNPELAKQFIAYMLDPEWQAEWMKASGYQVVPVYPALAEDEFWNTEAGRIFTDTPNYYQFLGAPGPFTPAAGEVYNSRLLTDALEQMIVNGMPLEEATASVQDAINQVIAQNQ